MSAELFNSIGGFSVGIPPIPIIDSNGNVTSNRAVIGYLVSNRIDVSGNVSAAYFLGNVIGNVSGNFVVPGTNTSLIFNQEGNAGASDALQFDYSSNALTLTGNLIVTRILTDNYLDSNGAPFTFEIAAAGSNQQIQFNNDGNLGADANFFYNSSLELLAVSNISAESINVAEIITDLIDVNGNVSANYFIGNLVGNISGANTIAGNFLAGTLTTAAQPNITSIGNLATLNVLGNASFLNANAGNITSNNLVANSITGSLVTASQPNITSVGTLNNLTVAGNGTFTNVNGGNLVTANFISGILTTATQSNITTVGNLQNLNVIANLAVGNNVTANKLTANTIVGVISTASQPNITSVGNLTNLNVVGNVTANVVSGNTLYGTLITSAQPNITSLGNLTSLTVDGNVSANNFVGNFVGNISNATYAVTANYSNFAGQATSANSATVASSANSVAGANVIGTVGNANFASTSNVSNTAGTVTTNAQPNITSVGTLSSLSVSGNISSGNLSANGNISATYISGTLSTGAQPGITSLGTLGNLTVSGNITASNFIGNITGNISNANFASYAGNVTLSAQSNITTVGTLGNLSVSGNTTTNNLLVNANISVSNLASINTIQTVNLTGTGNTTLARANISGNLTAGNVSGGNLVSANYITGTLTTNNQPNINYLGNLGWLNIDTSIANGNGNITFTGNLHGTGGLSSINITGNINAGNYIIANLLIGTLTTSSQPNITSIGTLTGLNVSGLSNLGNAGNVKILGGNANYVLSTDGTGNLSWVAQTGGGNGNGTPGGLTSQVQYNSNGSFAGDGSFTWNDTTKTLSVGNNITVANTVTSLRLISTVSNGSAPLVVTSTTPVANLGVETSGTVRNGAQPNITSVGTLTSLVVSGNANVGNLGVGGSFSLSGNFNAGNISTPGQLNTTGLTVTGNATFTNNATISSSGILRINGNLNAGNSANVYLGNVSNVKIDGGINGYVLQTDGAGGLSWTAQTGGGGNGVPGGSNTQVQYNDTGSFGGSAFFTFNESTNTVTVAGNLIANSFQMGAGIYRFSYSNVYQAITNTSNANQILWSVEADQISGVDFVIVSTDANANVRQVSKIFAVVLGSDVNYNETNTIAVNGYNGDFSVQYDPGNIITQPTVGLYFSPQSGNTMTHKMQITTYDN